MKKIIFALCGVAGLLLLFMHTGKAQEMARELPLVTVTAKASVAEVDLKISRIFHQMYPGATGMKWYRVEKNYLVEFIENHQEHTAVFQKSGAQVYHIRFGNESNLPGEIRNIVKTAYYDQTINHVYQVEQGKRSIWIISLEDEKYFIMTRVEDHEIEETERITKSH